MPSPADRALALPAGDAPADAAGRLRILRRFVLACGFVRSLVWLASGAPVDPVGLGASAAALGAAAALAFLPRLEHHAARLALPALALQLALTFPLTDDGWFLELYAVALLALAGPGEREAPLVLGGLRWLTAIVLFQMGLQKLSYGYYLAGELPALRVGRGEGVAALFQWLLPAAEVARLQGYQPLHEGAGPYRVAQPFFVALSNAVWVAQLALALGLLWRRTRTVSAAGAAALVLALQLGGRELGVGLLFANLVLLFAPAVWARRLFPVFLALLMVALAVTALAPGPASLEDWRW